MPFLEKIQIFSIIIIIIPNLELCQPKNPVLITFYRIENMDFWIRLKNEIKYQDTTQEWIAKKIGVPLSTFRKWMTRKTYPDIKEGVEIAKLLGISAEYLVTGNQPQGLNEKEQHMINAYRKLNTGDQEKIMLAINAWLKKQAHK